MLHADDAPLELNIGPDGERPGWEIANIVYDPRIPQHQRQITAAITALARARYSDQAPQESVEVEQQPPKESEGVYRQPIEQLRLTFKVENALRREKLVTIGLLEELSDRELLEVDGIGPLSLSQIHQALERYRAHP